MRQVKSVENPRTRAFVLVVIALPVLFLAAGCGKKEEKEEAPVVPVQVAAAQSESIERIVTADGFLRARDQAAIVPKISAPVRRFYVNRGDHVRHGQLLATLENRDLTASVAETKGVVTQAEANYTNTSSATVPEEMVKAQADLDAARQSLEAAKKLLDSRQTLYQEGALARKQVDEAAVAYAQAKGAFESAQKHLQSLQGVSRHQEVKGAAGQLESARGKYQAAAAQLAYSQVRSPLTGVVAERPLFAGEMAAAGTPMITVMDIASVIARVNVAPEQAAVLHVGQRAKITSRDSGVETDGRVTVVSPAVDAQTTTVEVWVQAPNPGERLRPGGAVRVSIAAGAVPNAVVVPAAALLPGSEGGTVVMVVGPDSIAHEHKVEVGVRNAGKVQIASGLNPGEQVVVAGGVGLKDGTKVKVSQPGEEEKGEAGEKGESGAGNEDEKKARPAEKPPAAKPSPTNKAGAHD